jgi:hypothetical protein
MAIDALQEELITLAQAARHARPRGSKPAAPSTIWRHHQKGIAGVRLETICVGGIRYTSVEALQRFIVAVTLARSKQDTPQKPNAETGTRSAAIKKRLQEAGLGDQHANRPTTSRASGKVTSPSSGSTTAGLDGWGRSDADGGTELPADLDKPP